jgi:dTDP-4-dehydrorhamnose 3,5-epimerase
MSFTELEIHGVWLHAPELKHDNRGSFHEAFKLSQIKELLNRDFPIMQVNQSKSSAGVVRGIHWTDSPQGQAKYVSCPKGLIWDVYVDLRPESTTYGKWGAQFISASNKKSLLISEGIGHAFLSLEEETIVSYLCTTEYNPDFDKAIMPLDANLDIPFEDIRNQFKIESLVISAKDLAGASFRVLSIGN